MKFNNPCKPYSIYNLNENSKIIIVCDHASNIIPKKYTFKIPFLFYWKIKLLPIYIAAIKNTK